MGLIHARTGSGQGRRACFSSMGTLGGPVPAQLPSARSRNPLKLAQPERVWYQNSQEDLLDPEGRMCSQAHRTGSGRPKAGSGLVERFLGPSSRIDWLDIFTEVAPGPTLVLTGTHWDSHHDASLSGTTSDMATPLLCPAWLCSLPTDRSSLLSVASMWSSRPYSIQALAPTPYSQCCGKMCYSSML